MQPDSRHAGSLELRLRIFASPQTTPARLLPIHLHALSSTRRWPDPAPQRHSIAVIPFSPSLCLLLSRSTLNVAPKDFGPYHKAQLPRKPGLHEIRSIWFGYKLMKLRGADDACVCGRSEWSDW